MRSRAAIGIVAALVGCGDDAPASVDPDAACDPCTSGASDESPREVEPGTASDESTAAPSDDEGDEGNAIDGSSSSSSSSDGGGDDDDGEPNAGSPPIEPPRFVDVTVQAGLDASPGGIGVAPFCVLDDVGDPGGGDFCHPERYVGAAAVGDYDGDGWVDVYVTRRGQPDRLMRNAGDGTFHDVTAAVGLDRLAITTGAAAWIDVEGDGDLDLALTAVGGTRHFLMIAEDGWFEEDAIARGAAVQTEDVHVGMGIAVGDVDLDGWLDLFVAEWRPSAPMGGRADHNRLLRNAGDGSFTDVTARLGLDLLGLTSLVDIEDGVYGFAPAFVDLDGDRFPDVTLAADFGTSRLLWSDGGQRFHDTTWASGVGTERNGMGSTFGDFDGDGDLDWFVSAIWTDEFPWLGHRLYRNEGDRTFVDVSAEHGVQVGGWGWGSAFFDHDLDGDLDLAMAAGWPGLGYAQDHLRLWDNVGDGPWPDVAQDLGIEVIGDGRGLVPLDHDGDGDLDLLVVGNENAPRLFRNDLTGRDWLVVRAAGLATNRQGIGVVVRVQAVAGGPVQLRHIGVGSHLMGQQAAEAHFGLGNADPDAPIHRVELTWPVSGRVDVLAGVKRNAVLLVQE